MVWSVLERDVRSDSDSVAERQRDEGQFSSEARQQNQLVARGLRQLGPASVRGRMLRDCVPFTVVTDATFASLKILGERLLGRLGLQGYSSITTTMDGYEWKWSIDPNSHLDEDALDEDVSALFESQVIKIALSEGQCVPTEGAQLSEDRRIATFPISEMLEGLEKHTGDASTVFVLRWTTSQVPPFGSS